MAKAGPTHPRDLPLAISEEVAAIDKFLHANGTLTKEWRWRLRNNTIMAIKDGDDNGNVITTVGGDTDGDRLMWLRGFHSSIRIFHPVSRPNAPGPRSPRSN